MTIDRIDLLERLQDAIPALPKGSTAEAKVDALLEGLAAITNLLAIFVSLYNEVANEDVTPGVIVALRLQIAMLADESLQEE